MSHWHGYFGIENLNLNENQRDLLVAALQDLGQNDSPFPQYRNHRRVRLDGQATIFEALWDSDTLLPGRIKIYLGNIFGIDPEGIDHELTSPGDNLVATFSRGGTDYLRMALFGGLGSTWQESRLAALAYLAANRNLWDGG
jgi:hypothetical protein